MDILSVRVWFDERVNLIMIGMSDNAEWRRLVDELENVGRRDIESGASALCGGGSAADVLRITVSFLFVFVFLDLGFYCFRFLVVCRFW